MSVTVATDYKGTFTQGKLSTFMIKITDFDGDPTDALSLSATITNEAGSVVKTTTPDKAQTGFYAFDWNIDPSQTPGKYVITWNFIVDGVSMSELQHIIITEDDTNEDALLYTGNRYFFRLMLESYLLCAQSIPVYFEQAKPSIDNKTYRFTFPRWNQVTGVKVYRNKEIVTDNYELNFFKGYVTFDDIQTDYDIVNSDYNFAWFSDEELNQYLELAIMEVNQFPPHTGYTFDTLPEKYLPAVLRKAAADALRKLMLCLQFQEPEQVFGGADAAQKKFSNMETLKKNFEDEWKLLMEQKKYGPYVGLTRMIVVPEYTLPGGRSRWFRYLFKSGSIS
jgi:hypothetical protein